MAALLFTAVLLLLLASNNGVSCSRELLQDEPQKAADAPAPVVEVKPGAVKEESEVDQEATKVHLFCFLWGEEESRECG